MSEFPPVSARTHVAIQQLEAEASVIDPETVVS